MVVDPVGVVSLNRHVCRLRLFTRMYTLGLPPRPPPPPLFRVRGVRRSMTLGVTPGSDRRVECLQGLHKLHVGEPQVLEGLLQPGVDDEQECHRHRRDRPEEQDEE